MGVTVIIAVDTTMVTSVPVPIWEVYDVTLAEVIGVGVGLLLEEVVIVTLYQFSGLVGQIDEQGFRRKKLTDWMSRALVSS